MPLIIPPIKSKRVKKVCLQDLTHEILHTLLTPHVLRDLAFHLLPLSIYTISPLDSVCTLMSVYSVEVKMVTRAEGHRGTPHPIELTSPG